MIELLISLLFGLLVIYLIWWAVSQMNLPAPIPTVVLVVLVIILLLWLGQGRGSLVGL